MGFVSMESNPTHFHVFANFLLMSFTVANGWESVCFHEIQPTHFRIFANFLLMSFTLLQIGWESVCCHVLMKHNLWSESIVTWQSVKQQLVGRPDNE
jgi:hypothetical protein